MRAAVAAGAALLVLCATATGATPLVYLSVEPREALIDAPLTIRATGLEPRQAATLQTVEDAYPEGKLVAERTVRADDHGVVELRNPVLLTLARPAPGSPKELYPYFERDLTVNLRSGATELASTHFVRNLEGDDVAVEEQRPSKTGLYADYYRPRHAHGRTAVLLLGGSEGGIATGDVAALIAAHGYPVLALAYFREPGLPKRLAYIPLEYFQRATHWLGKQPEVDPGRIVVAGISFGGQASLLLASTYPALFRAAASYVPPPKVTFGPQPLTSTAPGKPAWTVNGRPVKQGPIAVERFGRPLFLAGAVEDHLAASATSVLDVARRLRAHGRHDFSSLVYPRAGHGLGSMIPNTRTDPIESSREGVLDFGGTPVADELARRDSWRKFLRFLARFD